MATLGSPYDRAGSWTPTITFATPGDLSVTYATRVGVYEKAGRHVVAWFTIQTSAFTHTTASGSLTLTGLPFTVDSRLNWRGGALGWQGITKANYTHITPAAIGSTATAQFTASGSGQAFTSLASGDVPTGGTVILAGSVSYIVANT